MRNKQTKNTHTKERSQALVIIATILSVIVLLAAVAFRLFTY